MEYKDHKENVLRSVSVNNADAEDFHESLQSINRGLVPGSLEDKSIHCQVHGLAGLPHDLVNGLYCLMGLC